MHQHLCAQRKFSNTGSHTIVWTFRNTAHWVALPLPWLCLTWVRRPKLSGHTEILHTLIGMGSAALMAAVTYLGKAFQISCKGQWSTKTKPKKSRFNPEPWHKVSFVVSGLASSTHLCLRILSVVSGLANSMQTVWESSVVSWLANSIQTLSENPPCCFRTSKFYPNSKNSLCCFRASKFYANSENPLLFHG